MNDLFRELALQIAWSFVAPLAGVIATAICSWLIFWWQKLFKAEFDEKSRATIHEALARGMVATAEGLRARQGFLRVTENNTPVLLSGAAAYAEKWSGGTIKAKHLTTGDLMELARPHLPLATMSEPHQFAPTPATRSSTPIG